MKYDKGMINFVPSVSLLILPEQVEAQRGPWLLIESLINLVNNEWFGKKGPLFILTYVSNYIYI